MSEFLALGLMSGTSCDGVDIALLRTDGENGIEFLDASTQPYEANFRERLLFAAQEDIPLTEMLRLEKELTELHAAAAASLLSKADVASGEVAVAGFHGHTLRHVSHEGLTLQIGDASRLAELLGIPVVADFRRRDLAAGGQGAPLVPLFHQAVLRPQEKPLVVLNLGGVSNVTWLGPQGEIIASDAGPGCGLLDAWTSATTGQPFDAGGALACAGVAAEALVRSALELEFFARPMPKSADRFEFQEILKCLDHAGLTPADGAATLCEVTAAAVVQVCQRLPSWPCCLWVTGGGVRHAGLMQALARRFPLVRNVADAGLHPDFLEAECFAWLAVRRLRGLSTSLPSTTGCRHATCGGLLSR